MAKKTLGQLIIRYIRFYIKNRILIDKHRLRTFALKSSYGEIFFISRLALVDKVLTPKMKKKNGRHRLCFGENGSGKMR